MTANEAITRYKREYDGVTDEDSLMRYLNELEYKIYTEVILTHTPTGSDFDPAQKLTSASALLASGAYESLYIHWMESKSAYAVNEYEKYTSAMLMFNEEYKGFSDHYHRTHRSATVCHFTGF